MFCPRCGAQNTETTKFCRQCGLPMSQITNYVSAGGTAPIAQQQPPAPPGSIAPDGMTPKQKLILTILLFVFSPAIFAVFGEMLGLHRVGEALASISAVLMPIGIVWAVFRYKAQQRRLQQQQSPQQMQPPMPQHLPQQIYQPPTYQPAISPPPTNPLATPIRGSVTEDETQRLPESRQ